MLQCSTTVALALLATAEKSGDPAWVTAVVAGGSAVLGALVGGFTSYSANVALEGRRRKARAAVRRKAKVYTPLRAEVRDLREAIAKDAHLERGIDRAEPDQRGFDRAPRFYRWEQLVADGRATTSASHAVRERIEAVGVAVDDFNRRLTEARQTFSAQGRPLYEEMMGSPLSLVQWPALGDGREVVRNAPTVWRLFGIGTAEQERNANVATEFRRRFTDIPEVQQARHAVAEGERTLLSRIDDVVGELEAAMGRIAKKYEREEPED